jgi:hypothetical protein
MDIPLPEVLDRLSIVRLKIERIGEPHLRRELKEYLNAVEEFKKEKIEINPEWEEELYEINGKIWDLEFDVRKIINKDNCMDEAEKTMGFEELGRRALLVEKLMKLRVAIKNQITEKTKSGFKDIKINHCGA